MTSIAAKLLEDFKTLAPEEQLIVRNGVISLTEAHQRQALARLRGASAGKNPLATLLAERMRERARG